MNESFALGEQAHRVAVWAEWRRQEPRSTIARQYFVYVKNSSESPIYVERFCASKRKGEAPEYNDVIGIVGPHDLADYGLSEAQFPPDSDAPYVELWFLDVDRIRWSCDSEGGLRRLGASRPT